MSTDDRAREDQIAAEQEEARYAWLDNWVDGWMWLNRETAAGGIPSCPALAALMPWVDAAGPEGQERTEEEERGASAA
jgi:hypothetical protein